MNLEGSWVQLVLYTRPLTSRHKETGLLRWSTVFGLPVGRLFVDVFKSCTKKQMTINMLNQPPPRPNSPRMKPHLNSQYPDFYLDLPQIAHTH